RGEPRIGWIDVAGVYHGIPDLGYAKANFSSPGVEERQPEPEQPAQEPVDPEVLRTWQGEWYTSWRDQALGPDGSWEPGNVVSVQVDGLAAVVRNDNGEFISTTVTQGGRCIEWDPPSDQSGSARMRACLEPGGNSFTGSFGGLSYGQQVNFDGRGTRKSR
ncbi:MAG: hypothetical protein MUO50_09580, partial [Longimicrobiales bacterium]|nr:hypothetical protein [Longimicrobiales bacterium]